MFYKYFFIIALFFCSFALKAEDFVLTAEQIQEIKRVDALYGNYKVIRSRFIQKDDLGSSAAGWFVIERPGKARIEYDDVPIRFIAINNTLMFQDIKLKQKSFLSIKSSPFSHLLESNISFFDEKVKITGFASYEDYIEITIISKEYPEIGSLTLFLTKDSADIIKWNIKDARGVTTEVFLVSPVFAKEAISNQTIFNTQRIKIIKFDDIN